MAGRSIPSLEDLKALFAEASALEAASSFDGGAAPAASAELDSSGSPPPPQHHGLQPPRPTLSGHSEQQADGSVHSQKGRLSGGSLSGSLRGSFKGGIDTRLSGSTDGGKGKDQQLSAPASPTRALQPYGPQVAAQLQRRCVAACALLDSLQAPIPGAAGGGKPRLPSSALLFCKGLAFVQQRKAGVLGGWTWGDGLLIRRRPGGGWSAPLFLRLRFGSLGLTFGAQRVQAVYVLQTEEQVAAFARGTRVFSLDATMPGDLDITDVYAPVKPVKQQDLTLSPSKPERPQCALISDGLLWDLSLRGGSTCPHDRLNGQLYGAGAAVEDVLQGAFPLPPELQPLYQEIDARAAEAQVVRPTVSKFELARLRSIQHADWSNRSERSARAGREPSVHGGLRRGLHKSSSSASDSSSLPVSPDPSFRGGAAWPGSTQLGSLAGTSASPGSGGLLGASLAAGGGSPRTLLPGSGGSGGAGCGGGLFGGGEFKLFGDVEISLEEEEDAVPEQEEDAEAGDAGQAAAEAAEAAAAAQAEGGEEDGQEVKAAEAEAEALPAGVH